MKRPAAFISLFDTPGGKSRSAGQPSASEKELLRACVVFAVAALDAYLHDLVLEVVAKGRGDNNALSDGLRTIAKEDPSLALRVSLAESKEARQEEFRTALSAWLSTKSFQGPDAVIRALGYVGRPGCVSRVDAEAGPTWKADLQNWTTMRHGMVHRSESPYVRRSMAADCVELIKRIEQAIDNEVCGNP